MDSKSKAKKPTAKSRTAKVAKKSVSKKPTATASKKKATSKATKPAKVAKKVSVETDHQKEVTDSGITDEVVLLPAHIGVEDSIELKQRLLNRAESNAVIKLDAGAVVTASTAAMQLLLSFYHFSTKQVKDGVVWEGVSEAFYDSAKLLGFAELMNLVEPERSVEEDDGLCPVF